MTAAAVLEESKAEWLEDACFMIEQLSKAQDLFSADDLRKVLRQAPDPHWPGQAFSRVQAAGLIEWVEFRKSKTKSRKGAPVSVWKRKQEGVGQ